MFGLIIKKIQVQFEEKLPGEFFLKYTAKVQLRELKSFYQNAKKKSETEIKLDFILYCSNLQFDDLIGFQIIRLAEQLPN